jgi:hypothetical protein
MFAVFRRHQIGIRRFARNYAGNRRIPDDRLKLVIKYLDDCALKFMHSRTKVNLGVNYHGA